jgi:carbohydrate-selective porin OprB
LDDERRYRRSGIGITTGAKWNKHENELRTSYELAYYPTSAAKDGTFRKVVIRAERPGLTVRSTTGYFSR